MGFYNFKNTDEKLYPTSLLFLKDLSSAYFQLIFLHSHPHSQEKALFINLLYCVFDHICQVQMENTHKQFHNILSLNSICRLCCYNINLLTFLANSTLDFRRKSFLIMLDLGYIQLNRNQLSLAYPNLSNKYIIQQNIF